MLVALVANHRGDDIGMIWRFRRLPAEDRPGAPAAGAPAPAAGACWVDVGGLADLRDNRLVVELNGISILVVRAGRSVAAVENECPHLGRRLSDGRVTGGVIRCAAHGYRWDLTTGMSVQGRRAQRQSPLRAVPVRLAGDRIMLAGPVTRPESAGPGPCERGATSY